MKRLKLALDWTPNTNHVGFYVALALGYYSESGIDLVIEPPSDAYGDEETPARRVVNGTADMCIAPSESAISCLLSRDNSRIRPLAIAAVLQKDTSAIVTNKSEFVSPKDLSNAKYASYAGRFEMNIVNELVRKSGGTEVIEVKPPKLDCFDAMLRGEADATWIFQGWEGIQASRAGISLNSFPLPSCYGYSPVLLANPDLIRTDKDVLRKFLSCTERGYQYAVEQPLRAAELLFETASHASLNKLTLEFVVASQMYMSSTSDCYLDSDGRWGVMKEERWSSFAQWLVENRCLSLNGEVVTCIDSQQLYTNELY